MSQTLRFLLLPATLMVIGALLYVMVDIVETPEREASPDEETATESLPRADSKVSARTRIMGVAGVVIFVASAAVLLAFGLLTVLQPLIRALTDSVSRG